jgi:predicted permease
MKYAIRRLVKDWRFSAGAIAILALGVGANTAVFSILNNSLLQPHPFRDSARLVNVYQNDAKDGEPEGISYPALADLQRETAVFSAVAASHLTEGRYQAVDAQGRISTIRFGLFEFASANYLDVVGMRPSMGRWFSADEERRAEPVAVLGWTVWKREFGADPNVLGQTIIAGGIAVKVIGVGPATLNSSQNAALVTSFWMPVGRMDRNGATPGRLLEQRDNLFLQARARLREGVTIQQARAAMKVTAHRLAVDYPDVDPKRGITVLATEDVQVHPREKVLKPVAIAVLCVVGLVLAIACSNLATLLLVRSSARSAEISVRLALGATRVQLVRHLLLESVLLSLAGAALGVALAHAGLRYLATIDLPVVLSMQLDYRVLGFATLAAALCGLGFGLAPALQATRMDLAEALRDGRGSSGSSLSLVRGWFTLKNALVTGQVATSFLLLVAAALAMSILTATQNRGLGFRPEGLAIIETDTRYAGYDVARANAVTEDLRRRIANLPGVESACVTSGLPGEGQFDAEFRLTEAQTGEALQVEGRWAGPGYFETMGTRVLFGRVFDERDSPESPGAIVVSEAFARRYFGTSNAIGKRLHFADSAGKPAEIVGIVENARSIDMVLDTPKSFVYRSSAQNGKMPSTLVARTSRNEAALVNLMQQEARRLRPDLPVVNAMTMKQRQALELMPFRIAAVSLGALGGWGLLLALVGLYAVVSYSVARRSPELGIRIALGARPGDLTWLVVRDVSALILTGIGIGSALSWTGLAVFEASVARIVGVDLWSIARAALVIIACGAAAAYFPARRAVQTDPMTTIRRP